MKQQKNIVESGVNSFTSRSRVKRVAISKEGVNDIVFDIFNRRRGLNCSAFSCAEGDIVLENNGGEIVCIQGKVGEEGIEGLLKETGEKNEFSSIVIEWFKKPFVEGESAIVPRREHYLTILERGKRKEFNRWVGLLGGSKFSWDAFKRASLGDIRFGDSPADLSEISGVTPECVRIGGYEHITRMFLVGVQGVKPLDIELQETTRSGRKTAEGETVLSALTRAEKDGELPEWATQIVLVETRTSIVTTGDVVPVELVRIARYEL